MLTYKIEKIETIPCRVINVEKKVKDKKTLVIVHFGQYDNGKFVYTIIREESDGYPIYSNMLRYQENRKRFSIDKVLVCPNVSVYHKLTWDDVHKRKCSVRNLDKIERNDDGKPIVYYKILMFVNLSDSIENENNIKEAIKQFRNKRKREKREYEISNILQKRYIAVNDPNIQNALNYRNSFIQNYQQEEFCNDYYENYNDIDSTPENTVMDALENGMGELFGY